MSIGTDFPPQPASFDESPTYDPSVLETVRLAYKAYKHEVESREAAKLLAVEKVSQEYAAIVATATSVYFESMAAAHNEGFYSDAITAYIEGCEAVEGDTPS